MEVFHERKLSTGALRVVSDFTAQDSTELNDSYDNGATYDENMTQKEGNGLNADIAATSAETAQARIPHEDGLGALVTSSNSETINSEASLVAVTPLSAEKSMAFPAAALNGGTIANSNSPFQQPETQESRDQPLVANSETIANNNSRVSPYTDHITSIHDTERASGEMEEPQAYQLSANGAPPTDQAREPAAHAKYARQQEGHGTFENSSAETSMCDTEERSFESPSDEPLMNGGGSSTKHPTMNVVGPNNNAASDSALSDAEIQMLVAEMMDEAGADPAPASNNDHNETLETEGQPVYMNSETELQDGKPSPVTDTTSVTVNVEQSANAVTKSQESVGSTKPSSGSSSAYADVIDLLDSDNEEDSNLDTSQGTGPPEGTGPPAAKRQRMEGTPVSAGAAAYSAVARMPNGVVQQQNHTTASHQQQGPDPYRNPIYISPTRDFIPTWKNLLPMRQEQTRPQKNHAKAFQLTLLNVSEFTITPLRVGDEYTGHMTSLAGLRGTIKRVSKDHGNAFFEQDPDGGKWHIPLGAYHAFVGFLRNDPLVVHIEGISEAQLKIASLGKARLEKEFPSARKLVKFGVPKKLADTLAPFQRGGVDFVIEKEGRALIADEMGLGKSILRLLDIGAVKGKTIQGIASMAVFHEEWPLLVLCPSSARYHWESEFRSWLGKDSATAEHAGAFDAEEGKESEGEDEDTCEPRPQMLPLEDDEINVLISGQDPLFPHQLTKVVICSYGLAPNLASSGKILPGMFRCAIVDESHMLKNKATQRTKNLLPVLKAMSRCVLLSGTPAFARPTELWPQLDILGCKRHGWWQDEAEFMKKYARGSKQRRAELHTMLLGTVMIRRMKNDILKTLPAKVREQGVVDVMDDSTRTEMKQCMATLRSGNGKLSELARGAETEQEQGSIESQASTNGVSAVSARLDEKATAVQLRAATAHLEQEMEQYRAEGRRQIQHTLAQNPMDQMTMQSFAQQMESRLEDQLRSHYKEQSLTIQREIAAGTYSGPGAVAQPDPASEKKLVLNHMYTLTGKCKTPLVVEMLKRWLNDPTKGKLCIFAHHISVLDELVAGAGLSNATESSTKYIRIDGSTTPRSRQDQINTFQRDSSVRIAILGITAAGVAVTLTASSTVWFAELFWTPAIMVQAEDRCHRIGQQAQVKCLYFVAKGTLDELLWKLLENKFQSLGEFVEGKEKLKIVVNNTYHSSHELLKTVTPDAEEENLSDANSECSLSDVQEISSDLEHEIEELGLSEQKLLATGEDSEDFEAGNRDEPDAKPAAKDNNTNTAGASIDEAICLSDDDEDVEEGHPGQSDAQKETGDATDIATIPQQAVAKKPAVCDLKTSTFPDLRIYRLYFSGPRYGIHFSFIEGRLVVAGTDDDRKQRFGQEAKPHIGEVLVGINRQIVPPVPDMKVVLSVLATEKSTNNGITELMFAEDSSIKNHMIETITRERDRQVAAAQQPAVAAATANVNIASDGVIEID